MFSGIPERENIKNRGKEDNKKAKYFPQFKIHQKPKFEWVHVEIIGKTKTLNANQEKNHIAYKGMIFKLKNNFLQ